MRIATNASMPTWRDLDVVTMEKAEAVLIVPGDGAHKLLHDAADKGMSAVVLAAQDKTLADAALELGYPEKAVMVYRDGKMIALSGELDFPVVRGGMRLRDVGKVLKQAVEESWIAEPVLKLGLEERPPKVEPVVELELEDTAPQHEEAASLEPKHVDVTPSDDLIGAIFGDTEVFALIPIGNIDTAPIAAGLAEALDGVRVEATFSPRGPLNSEPYLHFDGNGLRGDTHRLAVAKRVILEVQLPNLVDHIARSQAKAIMITAADYNSSQQAASFVSQWLSLGAAVHALLIIGDRDGNIAGTFRHRFKDAIPMIYGIDTQEDLASIALEIAS